MAGITVSTVGHLWLLKDSLSRLRKSSVHLAKALPVIPDPWDGDVGTWTEADYPGYSPQLLGSFSPVRINDQSQAETDTDTLTFLRTASGDPQTIYAYWVVDAQGHVLFADLARDPAPVLTDSGDKFGLRIQFLRGKLC